MNRYLICAEYYFSEPQSFEIEAENKTEAIEKAKKDIRIIANYGNIIPGSLLNTLGLQQLSLPAEICFEKTKGTK